MENYDRIDGPYSGNSDAKDLSIGIAGKYLTLDPVPHTGSWAQREPGDSSRSAGGIGLLMDHLRLEMVAR
ncbi:hypothetical protein [Pseudomonas putida]|uniref:hypothetical protein n=1 Tax=Pseudomonas putida TaxID=303 RepID=UPI00390584FD